MIPKTVTRTESRVAELFVYCKNIDTLKSRKSSPFLDKTSRSQHTPQKASSLSDTKKSAAITTNTMSFAVASSRSLSSNNASNNAFKKYQSSSSYKRCISRRSSPGRKGAMVVRADLEPDNISVLVAGGSGVAMDVFRQLTAAGTWVTVLQRHEDNKKEVRGSFEIDMCFVFNLIFLLLDIFFGLCIFFFFFFSRR